MTYAVKFPSAVQGILLGVMISLIFSALPLLQVRNIKPKLLLRDENNANLRKLDPAKWIFGAFSLAGLLGLAVWQAGSVKVGAFFLGGLGATSLVLYVAAVVLTFSPGAHAVLTHDLVDEPGHPTRAALERVLAFFADRLRPAPA